MNSTVIGNGQTSINGQTSTNRKTSQNQARATDPRSARTNRQTQPGTPNTGNIQSNVVEGNSITQKNSVIGNGQNINNTLNKIG